MKSSEKEEDTRLQTLTTSTRIETKNSNIPLLARMYTVKRKDSISSSSDEEGIKRKAFIIKRDAPQVPIPSFGSEPKENSCVNRRNERQNFFIPKLVRLNGAITKRQESFNNCLDEAIESSFDSEAEEEPSKKLDKINLARIQQMAEIAMKGRSNLLLNTAKRDKRLMLENEREKELESKDMHIATLDAEIDELRKELNKAEKEKQQNTKNEEILLDLFEKDVIDENGNLK